MDEESPDKYSLDQLRKMTEREIAWKVREKLYASLTPTNRTSGSQASEIAEDMRMTIRQFTQPTDHERSELREVKPEVLEVERLKEALEGIKDQKREFSLAQILSDARQDGINLEDRFIHLAETIAPAQLGLTERKIVVLAGNSDRKLVEGVLRRMPEKGQVVLFLPGSEFAMARANLRETFATEIATRRLIVSELDPKRQWTLAKFVDSIARSRGVSKANMMQVLTDSVAEKLLHPKELKAVYT